MVLAILLALVAATGFGVAPIFARLGLQHMRSTTGTAVSLAVGFLLVGTIAVAVYRGEMLAFPAVGLLWFALLGLLNYPGGRFFNFLGVHLAGVSRAAPIMATAPLVATALSVALGGETLTPTIALGTVTIVAGLVLILSERTAH